jgi:hypothetical protein
MMFEISESGHPRFRGIPPLLADLLMSVAEDPWEQYPEGSARLLPQPGVDDGLCDDWEDHVRPDLRRHFDSGRDRVAEDLRGMKQAGGAVPTWDLEIPAGHTDAWLVTLNALRLALVSEHGFGERELSGTKTPDPSDPRELALLRVNFYAMIQECLLRYAGSLDPGESGEGIDDGPGEG